MPTRCRKLPLLALLFPLACGTGAPEPVVPVTATSASASPAKSAAVEPPEGPLPRLRSGAIARIDATQALEGRVVAWSVDDGYETLEVELMVPFSWDDSTFVSVEGAGPKPWAFGSRGRDARGEQTVAVWNPPAARRARQARQRRALHAGAPGGARATAAVPGDREPGLEA